MACKFLVRSSSFMSSLPMVHLMLACCLRLALMVFARRSLTCLRFAFAGTTQPALGLGILPFGPRMRPKTFAMSVIKFACAMKKSYSFASCLIFFLSAW